MAKFKGLAVDVTPSKYILENFSKVAAHYLNPENLKYSVLKRQKLKHGKFLIQSGREKKINESRGARKREKRKGMKKLKNKGKPENGEC